MDAGGLDAAVPNFSADADADADTNTDTDNTDVVTTTKPSSHGNTLSASPNALPWTEYEWDSSLNLQKTTPGPGRRGSDSSVSLASLGDCLGGTDLTSTQQDAFKPWLPSELMALVGDNAPALLSAE